MRWISLPAIACAGLWACGESSTDDDGFDPTPADSGVAADSGTELPDTGTIDSGPRVAQFGHAETRQIVQLGSIEDGLNIPRDLEFNPERAGELWIVNELQDNTVIYFEAGGPSQRAEVRTDVSAPHFMADVSSLAFGENSTFATCQESDNGGNDFMGPSLWPSDLEIYARVNQTNPGPLTNGSHLDMLHQSPWCMGIAHLAGNGYFVFDGAHGHVVFYDFQADHGPGADDHSDGIVRRYLDAEVTRVPTVPGHMIIDKPNHWLYVADTGGKRVLRMDVSTGAVRGTRTPMFEPLAELSLMGGAVVDVFISSGLEEPSGIELYDGKLFVSDHATGEIVAYDLGGVELERIATGATSIMGLAIDPRDGRIWYVDGGESALYRIDP